MTVGRRLCEALGSWLHLEFCCHRGGLFSENSFKAAIGGVISTLPPRHVGARVHADFPLPCIAPTQAKRGPKPSVDFAYALDAAEGLKDPQLIVEAKWAASGHCSSDNIFQDFIRLSLTKRAYPDAHCVFVMAGPSSAITTKLQTAPFAGLGDRRGDVIGTVYGGQLSFQLKASNIEQRRFRSSIQEFVGVGLDVPSMIVTRCAAAYPQQTPNNSIRFQAIAWEILEVRPSNINPAEW